MRKLLLLLLLFETRCTPLERIHQCRFLFHGVRVVSITTSSRRQRCMIDSTSFPTTTLRQSFFMLTLDNHRLHLVLPHLTGSGLREAIEEAHDIRQLIFGNLPAAVSDNISLGDIHWSIIPQDNCGRHTLSHHVIRNADDGCLGHSVVRVQNRLDLNRIHIFATDEDHVFGSVDYGDIPICRHRRKIARLEPRGLRGRVDIEFTDVIAFPVSTENRETATYDFAHVPAVCTHGTSGRRVHHTHANKIEWPSRGAHGIQLSLQRGCRWRATSEALRAKERHRNLPAGFGHSVGGEKLASNLRKNTHHDGRWRRRATGRQESKTAEVTGRDQGI